MYVRLTDAVLVEAQMQGADLTSTEMQGADLKYAKMQGADLKYAEMQGASLRSAKMQGAILSNANIQGAILNSAQMQGVDLTSAKIQGAYLMEATLFNNNFDKSILLWNRWQGAEIKQPDKEEWDQRIAAIKNDNTEYISKSRVLKRLDAVTNILFDDANESKQDINKNNAYWQTIISKKDNESEEFLTNQAQWLADNILCTDFYARLGLVRNALYFSKLSPTKVPIFAATIEKNTQCQTIPDDVPADVKKSHEEYLTQLKKNEKK